MLTEKRPVTGEEFVVALIVEFEGQSLDLSDRSAAAPLKVQQKIRLSSKPLITGKALQMLLFMNLHVL